MDKNNKWYLSTWFIALCCACWFLVFPTIAGIILLIIRTVNDKKQQEQLQFTYNQNSQLLQENTIMKQKVDELIKSDKLSKSVATQERKVSRSKELYKSLSYAFDNFIALDIPYDNCLLSQRDLDDAELISPSVTLKLHCMDVKSLRKAYKENEKLIDNLLKQYSTRYTTKANKSIYDLMVIALMAELQNILYALKYEKLDVAIQHVKDCWRW